MVLRMETSKCMVVIESLSIELARDTGSFSLLSKPVLSRLEQHGAASVIAEKF